MRAREFPVLLEAVETGAARAVGRFWKHRDNPLSTEMGMELVNAIAEEVTNEICERFELEEVRE